MAIANMDHVHALVVGASQGIGLGFVQRLLSEDSIDRVYATYRNAQTAEALFKLRDDAGERLVCVPMDLTQESTIIEGLALIRTTSERLDLVINCVGFLHTDTIQPEKSLRQLDTDHLLQYFHVNSVGPVLLAKHLVPLLKKSDRSILATISAKIGSIGDNYLGGWYGYRASKAALNMFMRTTAIEYGRKTPKTIVVVLHPGTTDTQLSKPFQKNVPASKLFSVEKTVSLLLTVIGTLKQEDSGHFFSWDGNPLPW